MREAYRGKLAVENRNPLLTHFRVGDEIVLKDYNAEVKEQAKEKDRSLRNMAMKEVQTQMIVSHLAKQFKQNTNGILDETPDVIPCFILERKDANPDDPILMMEVALTGTFEKYLVNDGSATKQGLETEHGKICLAFAHWTFEYTEEALVVTDLQGVKLRLTDVEVSTKEKGYFGIGNLGSDAIATFKDKHVCNDVCKSLGLKNAQGEAVVAKSKFKM
ncbi:hypothetical protein OS493_020780 [Desmophyllum pertusum]|uniref:Alpha-type protein kinase domain-containing protein n=1 Tax=Desmophyllum pertusum TaxID=174260 RepID=A0A9W9YN31_9CNID|nr:hypothetical protein OS493_020780 [Desmophyllum pertusum]